MLENEHVRAAGCSNHADCRSEFEINVREQPSRPSAPIDTDLFVLIAKGDKTHFHSRIYTIHNLRTVKLAKHSFSSFPARLFSDGLHRSHVAHGQSELQAASEILCAGFYAAHDALKHASICQV